VTPAPSLIGTSLPPTVRIGRRVHCRYRGKACRVTSYTDAPIPWPRVQPLGQRGGSGLWGNETLEKAIRTEGAVALGYWFGLSKAAVHSRRVWVGVEGWIATPGSQRAIQAAADAGADATRGTELSDEACDLRAENAKRLRMIEYARSSRWPGGWTAEMDALLGTMSDGQVAKRVGKSRPAVRARRVKLGIPAAVSPEAEP
jgi:hypothetical protein